MGREIVYCHSCGIKIVAEELEEGKAICVANKNYCVKCKADIIKTLPADEVERILQKKKKPQPKEIPPAPKVIPKPVTAVSVEAPAEVVTPRRNFVFIFTGIGALIALGVVVILTFPPSQNHSRNNPAPSNKTSHDHEKELLQKLQDLRKFIREQEGFQHHDKILNRFDQLINLAQSYGLTNILDDAIAEKKEYLKNFEDRAYEKYCQIWELVQKLRQMKRYERALQVIDTYPEYFMDTEYYQKLLKLRKKIENEKK
jgi:hypothetical protein